mmetsp:Transcript_81980/g.162807  ORF Transcript_81980/g.162807 Transcript_81980/m.162807 type:complete len:147 (+) Transcript_81980:237-677(+)
MPFAPQQAHAGPTAHQRDYQKEPHPPALWHPQIEATFFLLTRTARRWRHWLSGSCGCHKKWLSEKCRRAATRGAVALMATAIVTAARAKYVAHDWQVSGALAAAPVRLATVPAQGIHRATMPIKALNDVIFTAVILPWAGLMQDHS